MVYLPAVTHCGTNRTRRRVTSFQPKRVTNYATPPDPSEQNFHSSCEAYSVKVVILLLLRIDIELLLIVTRIADELLLGINIDDFELP